MPDQVAQGLSARAYIYTDRPAYRPGHKVAIRGVVREVSGGQYAHVPKAVYRFEVADSRGRLIAAHPVTLSEFGTFHETLALDTRRPRRYLPRPGLSARQERLLRQLRGSVISARADLAFLRLEENGLLSRRDDRRPRWLAKYQYGAPLAGRPIEVQLPDGRILHGTTDAAGQYQVEFPTEGFAEEQSLSLAARLPQDNVATAAT